MANSRLSQMKTPFASAAPISPQHYPGFNPGSYVLKKGHVAAEGCNPLPCDILVEQDVSVTLRDGVVIRTDIYRPVDDGALCPAIIGWSPYGKRIGVLTTDTFGHPTRMDVPRHWEDGLNKFEGPNPSYWVAHGYAVIAPDPRGVFMSEGDIHAWGPQEPLDGYDLIEWVGTRPWSNGKVGLTGNSWLAITQWFAAALCPPHLAAIAPWEGASDIYRDTSFRGGIPDPIFTAGIFRMLAGQNKIEDMPAMMAAHPLLDGYWAEKVADLANIDVPAYVVASWTNLLHTAGTLRGWREMSSRQKWLRVHNTHEWTDYYTPGNVDDLRRFFDRFLKGEDNDWEKTPAVRLAVLDPGHDDVLDRPERAFPLDRQEIRTLYLSQSGLERKPAAQEADTVYDGTGAAGASFKITFSEDTEIAGYIKLRLWVEARGHDDMDVFAYIRKIDKDGKVQEPRVVSQRTHVGPNGRLRVSRRFIDESRSTPQEPFQTFDREEKLRLGEVVPLDIGFWPYAMRWHAGETLELLVTGTDLLIRPEFPGLPKIPTINKGDHVLHFGGRYDSHLLIPVIPKS